MAGLHAATIGGVRPGAVVAVENDGAVGLCAVLAAKRLGANRVVTFSRHPSRQALARTFGANHVVVERGTQGTAALRDLLGGSGRASCSNVSGPGNPWLRLWVRHVPASASWANPTAAPKSLCNRVFEHNLTVAGGSAPVRAYLPSLIPNVLSGSVNPGLVFDLELPLEPLPEA